MGSKIEKGSIDTSKIYETHRKIKELCISFNTINKSVKDIIKAVDEAWEGDAFEKFNLHYRGLMNRITDFSDMLYELYDTLVEAEVVFESADANVKKAFSYDLQTATGTNTVSDSKEKMASGGGGFR